MENYDLLNKSRLEAERRPQTSLAFSIDSESTAAEHLYVPEDVVRESCLHETQQGNYPAERGHSLFHQDTTRNGLKKSVRYSVTQPTLSQSCELLRLADSQWNEQILSALKTVSHNLLARHNLPEDWGPLLTEASRQAVMTVHPKHMTRGDSMDLGHYILCAQVNSSVCFAKFLEGLVIVRRTSSFELPETSRMLFIKDTSESNEDPASVTLFKRLLQQVQANLLIITSGLLSSEGSKTKVEHIHPRVCELLVRASGGQPVSAVDSLTRIRRFVGCCQVRHRVEMSDDPCLVFEGFTDRSLAGTIVLGVPSPQRTDLVLIEKITCKLLRVCRDLFLQAAFLDLIQVDAGPFLNLGSDFAASVFTIHKGFLCGQTRQVTSQGYCEEDQALGQFIESFTGSSPCLEQPQHTEGEHIRYYLRGTRRVFITVSSTTKMQSPDVLVSRYCDGCNVILATSLSETASELSVHSLIKLLLSDSVQDFTCAYCQTPALSKLQLIFSTQTSAIAIGCEPNMQYTQAVLKNLAWPKKQDEAFCQYLLESITTPGLRLLRVLHNEVLDFFQTIDLKVPDPTVRHNLHDLARALQSTISQHFVSIESRQIQLTDTHLTLQVFRRGVLNSVLSALSSLLELHKACLQSQKTGFWTPSKAVKDFQLNDSLLALMGQELPDLNKTNPLLSGGVIFPSIPVDEELSISAVAHALNSQEYQDKVVALFLKKSGGMKTVLTTSSHNSFRFHFSNTSINGDSSTTSWRVKTYFAEQLHCVRLLRCGSEEDFLLSISAVCPGTPAKLAKKGSFRFTHDRKYIVKTVSHSEMKTFFKIGAKYFEYISEVLYEGQPSLMVQILGAFKVKTVTENGLFVRIEYLLVFENLGFSLSKPTHVYDLKGTLNQRRKVEATDERTKMDLNFVEDFEGIPVSLDADSRVYFEQAVYSDTRFLTSQNIVDYSLLVLLSSTGCKFAMGIIDYTEQYTFNKAIEYRWKKRLLRDQPTITEAESYSKRFREHLCFKYFV